MPEEKTYQRFHHTPSCGYSNILSRVGVATITRRWLLEFLRAFGGLITDALMNRINQATSLVL